VEIDDPVFGRLVWVDDAWEGEVQLTRFGRARVMVRVDVPPEAPSDAAPAGCLQIVAAFFGLAFGRSADVDPPPVRRVPPGEMQRAAFRRFVEREAAWFEAIGRRIGAELLHDGRPVGADQVWQHLSTPFIEVAIESASVVLLNLHWDTPLDEEHGVLESIEVTPRGESLL
jgi:hypothetical protein